jgi:SAM-dependent methyltransferase
MKINGDSIVTDKIDQETQFYEHRYRETLPTSEIEPDKFALDSSQPGHRYFCVQDYLSNPGDLIALEWGVGYLSQLLFYKGLFKEYHAIDIAANVIIEKYAQQDLPELTQHNLNYDLPYRDDEFDVIIAMMVIEHLFNPFHSFKEISRLLKPGGVAFVNLPLITSIKNRARLLLGKLPVTSSRNWWTNEEWDGGHLHYFTIEAVTKLGQKYALNLEQCYPVGNLYGLKKIFPALLCNELSFVFRKQGF